MQRLLLATLAGCACGAASLLGAARPVGAIDYADNGGFEAGTSGWSVNGGTLAVTGSSVVVPAAGAASAEMTMAAASATLRQAPHPALPAGAYHASIAARAASSDVPVVLRVTTGDATVVARQQLATAVAGVWTVISLDFTTSAAADIDLRVAATAAIGTVVYFDDARLEGPATGSTTPTPTEIATTPTASASTTSTVTATVTPTSTTTPDDYVGDLRNGGFEDVGGNGSIAAWQRIGGAMSPATAPVRSGSRAARFESTTSSTKWLYQTVAATPGGWYEFSAWLLDDDAGVSSAFLRISWYASADGSGSALATADSTARLDAAAADYRRLTTGAVAAPDGAHSARVRVMLAPAADAPAAIYVDDAAFASTSPATATTTAAASDDAGGAVGGGPESAAPASSERIAHRAQPASKVVGALRAPRSAGASIVINEVLYDPDADAADASAEWVELYNAGDADQSLAGWTLSDAAAADTLPAITVRAGSYAILAASASFLDAYPQYDGPVATLGGRIGNSLGNDGDALVLKDAANTAVDAISWGDDTAVLEPAIADVPEGHSIERGAAGVDTGTAEDFIDNRRPSPGRAYVSPDANPQPQIVRRPVPLLLGSGAGVAGWLVWTAIATSSMALAFVLGWRALPVVRGRVRRAQ